MIAINIFTTYFNQYKTRLGNITAIIFVASDEEVPESIKDISGTILIIVLPSAASRGNLDTFEDVNTSIIFALTKRDHSDLNQTAKLAAFQTSQQTILAVRSLMLHDCADYSAGCNLMHGLDTENIQIDPVNYYRGWIGWGMVWEGKSL